MSHLADFGPKKTSMARLLGRKKSGGAAEGDLTMEQKMEQKDMTIARLMEDIMKKDSTYIKYLTLPKAFFQIFLKGAFGIRNNKWIEE